MPRIRFPLLVPSQDPAVSPHSGSQAAGNTALRSWLLMEQCSLLDKWEESSGDPGMSKQKLFGATEPCILALGVKLLEREIWVLNCMQIVTKQPLGVVGDHIVQALLTVLQWEGSSPPFCWPLRHLGYPWRHLVWSLPTAKVNHHSLSFHCTSPLYDFLKWSSVGKNAEQRAEAREEITTMGAGLVFG